MAKMQSGIKPLRRPEPLRGVPIVVAQVREQVVEVGVPHGGVIRRAGPAALESRHVHLVRIARADRETTPAGPSVSRGGLARNRRRGGQATAARALGATNIGASSCRRMTVARVQEQLVAGGCSIHAFAALRIVCTRREGVLIIINFHVNLTNG